MLVLSIYKHISKASKHPNPLEVLLKPSWLSGLIGVVLSIAIVVGAVASLFYRSSSLQLLIDLQKDATADYQAIDADLTANAFISNIPLFIFWAAIGVIAYAFTAAIITAFKSAVELEEEMKYVHIRRKELITFALERLFIRLGALAIWILYLNFTLHTVIPYAIAVGYAGTVESSWLQGSLYILGGISVLTVCSHAHTVLLRLIALKPRLFG